MLGTVSQGCSMQDSLRHSVHSSSLDAKPIYLDWAGFVCAELNLPYLDRDSDGNLPKWLGGYVILTHQITNLFPLLGAFLS